MGRINARYFREPPPHRHDAAQPTSLGDDKVRSLLQDRDGRLWVGTVSGLQRLSRDRHTFENMAGSTQEDAAHGVDVETLFQAQDGKIWLGTLKHGAAWLQPHPPGPAQAAAKEALPLQWLALGQSQPGQLGLSHPWISGMAQLQADELWLATRGGGINIVAASDGRVLRHLRHDQSLPGSLALDSVKPLLLDRSGLLWLGTWGEGLQRFNSKNRMVRLLRHSPHLPQKFLLARDGSLWIAGSQGLGLWREGQDRIERLNDPQGKPMQSRVSTLAEDQQGRLWVGSSSGLWLLEPGSRQLRAFHPEPGRADSLLSNYVYGLLVDRKNRLWVSSDKGLQLLIGWQGQQPQFANISERLDSVGVIFGANLMEDQQGRIWTEGAVIDPQQMRVTLYFKVDGMDIGTIWNASYAQSRDGLMFFGGTKGVAVLDPSRFQRWDHVPPLVVTELKINGLPSPLQELASSNPLRQPPRLTLSPEQRHFSIGFAVLDFAEPQKNRYEYRLDGYDKNWIETDAEHRSAEYGNLWPGQYTLQVRGSNRLGDWSQHELSLTIQVLPRWYQTWWFFLLLASLLLTALAAVIQARTRYLRQRQQELEALVQSRTLALKNTNQELQESNASLKQAQARIVQQEKLAALGSLVAGVAHELNTPLGNCLMVASNLEDATREIGQEVQQGRLRRSGLDAYFDSARYSCELLVRNLSSAANLIVSFKQIAVDQTSEQRRVFNLLRLVQEVLQAFATQLQQAGCSIQLEIPEALELDSFPGPLSQVIISLLNNSLTHAFAPGQDGTIRISAQQMDERHLQLQFGDDGAGIAAEDLPHVFEPFFTTRMGQGCYGLGLSISYNLVTAVLGGSITLHSTPGQGSQFEISLPLRAPAKA